MKHTYRHTAAGRWVMIIGLSFIISHFTPMSAQQFFNLTAEQVKIDSLLPSFTYTRALGTAYADSVYDISIEYPEFIDMSEAEVARYLKIAEKPQAGGPAISPLPALPEIEQWMGVSRREGTLYASFVPLVFRDGRYQKLVSFMLKVESQPVAMSRETRDGDKVTSSRYAESSVLSTGRWAKIRVPSTGVYELTSAVVHQAGFSDVNKVRIFGYGGNLQPEKLTGAYLQSTDDLKEVATCTVNGHRLFHAVGPVSWSSNTAVDRTRNPYSDYGYYFLTDGDNPLTVDSAAFVSAFYPSPGDYHSIREVDNYAWFRGGRNLYENDLYKVGEPKSYTLGATSTDGTLTISMSYNGFCKANVAVNGQDVGKIEVSESLVNAHRVNGIDSYSKAAATLWTFKITEGLTSENTITITQESGANMRLDYLQICSSKPSAAPKLSTTQFEAPEYVYNITNQNHHADPQADMVIIVPTSQKLMAQAQRLQLLHQSKDLLRVNVVPADELFNEFSSGTPDATAYRRYMKMLYDRATTDADMPRYLLLFGDSGWDNRMLTGDWKSYSPDDFLLCYESENSFSETECYVTDDYFCMLDDNEGGDLVRSDKADVAVGRMMARTDTEAKTMVDKVISYVTNEYAGAWQNTLCFMGDDGNQNMHMSDCDTAVIRNIQRLYPSFNIKKIYWDAYTREVSSTGYSYPDVTRLIKQQMLNGALVMNYTGHGAAYTVSHEQVVSTADFAAPTSLRLPLWVTASCDIMPFDSNESCIGETAMLNANGGAIAFFGTTRTVYSYYNRYMNKAFMEHVLASPKGRRNSIGEAVRLAKNELITQGRDRTTNKLQYSLLGDPAVILASPTIDLKVDNINGQSVDGEPVRLSAGQTITVSGSVPGNSNFNGIATITVRDVEQTIVCKRNNPSEADAAFTFKDRPNTLYTGSDSVRNGRFNFTFALPKDISYADATGLITLYAVNAEKTISGHGRSEGFSMGSDADATTDGIGPSIYCYLNTSSFTNGGSVNPSPFFYAEISDNNGINASGSGIGHDLELIIDGEMSRTYSLNDYFSYNFGDYRSGTIRYNIPELPEGNHKLLFRAWDVLNNPSTAELAFKVVKGLEPSVLSVDLTRNPATTSTTFIINHDRAGSQLDIEIDIFDMSGRQLWKLTESGVSSTNTYTIDWDLRIDGGRPLNTGVYLYRVQLGSDGSSKVSQAKKLIVLRK